MRFTFAAYENMLRTLADKGYVFCGYNAWDDHSKVVILRHDVDYNLEAAVRIAEIEERLGISSTFFVLLTSDFYNVFSKRSNELIQKILKCGHRIGLHYDEERYDLNGDCERIKESIIKEAGVLSEAIGVSVDSVSMHRPSRNVLEADLKIPGIINSYSTLFFREFKYLSDSRRRWREPVDELIASGEYERMHILTHPFWYGDEERSIHDSMSMFINSANAQRYSRMEENITDLHDIMDKNEVR